MTGIWIVIDVCVGIILGLIAGVPLGFALGYDWANAFVARPRVSIGVVGQGREAQVVINKDAN